MLDPCSQVCGSPGIPVHRGVEAGDLGRHVRVSSGISQRPCPWLPPAFPDRWFAQVVDDDTQSWQPLRQQCDLVQMIWAGCRNVEAQVPLGKHGQAFQHILTQQPVRLVLLVDEMTDPHQTGAVLTAIQRSLGFFGASQQNPADDACHPRPAVGDLEHVLGVGDRVRRLNEHRPVDPAGIEVGFEVGFGERAVDGSKIRTEPWILNRPISQKCWCASMIIQSPSSLVSRYDGSRPAADAQARTCARAPGIWSASRCSMTKTGSSAEPR